MHHSETESKADVFENDGLYDELRRMAQAMMNRQPPGHTLQATAVVHEAWLRLTQRGATIHDRGHLLALGSRAIRQVLVDHARKKRCLKRAGDRQRVPMDEAMLPGVEDEFDRIDLIALDEALDELVTFGSRQSQVVELRFFGGLTMVEVADALNVSKKTAENDWAVARAWLRPYLEGDG